MSISGTAIVYGDDISTDLIYPGRYTYLLLTDEQVAEHAMEDLDPGFKDRDARGAIIVAGNNFGCGSAREQAVKCLKIRGVAAVVAKSISRIYYRNCINEGLLPIVCPEAVDAVRDGETLEIDIEKGELATSGGLRFPFPKFPPFVREILKNGGLIPSVRKEIADKASNS